VTSVFLQEITAAIFQWPHQLQCRGSGLDTQSMDSTGMWIYTTTPGDFFGVQLGQINDRLMKNHHERGKTMVKPNEKERILNGMM